MTADRLHHPLPASDDARHDRIPETIERERPRGDDDPGAVNRGQRAGSGSGAAAGSGSGAGGGGSAEDFDDDLPAGGGHDAQGQEDVEDRPGVSKVTPEDYPDPARNDGH